MLRSAFSLLFAEAPAPSPDEGFAVRLENDVLIRASGNLDLMADIPIEAEEIEERMQRRKR